MYINNIRIKVYVTDKSKTEESIEKHGEHGKTFN